MIEDDRTIGKCRSDYSCEFCGGVIPKGSSYESLETFWHEYGHVKVHNKCRDSIFECFEAGCDEDAYIDDIFDFYEDLKNE